MTRSDTAIKFPTKWRPRNESSKMYSAFSTRSCLWCSASSTVRLKRTRCMTIKPTSAAMSAQPTNRSRRVRLGQWQHPGPSQHASAPAPRTRTRLLGPAARQVRHVTSREGRQQGGDMMRQLLRHLRARVNAAGTSTTEPRCVVATTAAESPCAEHASSARCSRVLHLVLTAASDHRRPPRWRRAAPPRQRAATPPAMSGDSAPCGRHSLRAAF